MAKHTMSRWGIGVKMVAISVLYALPAGAFTGLFPDLFALPVSRWTSAVAGGVLLLFGVSTLIWAGRAFTLGFERGELITNGPFKWVRNPIYTAWIFLLIPGLGLLCNSWLLLLTPLVTYFNFARSIHVEEEYLTKRFGQCYLDYRARTGRLLPKFHTHSQGG